MEGTVTVSCRFLLVVIQVSHALPGLSIATLCTQLPIVYLLGHALGQGLAESVRGETSRGAREPV
jgi:hypothetical protein